MELSRGSDVSSERESTMTTQARILLAESDVVSCRVIRAVLQDEPDFVLEQVDHTSLVASLRARPPDMVIVDINSPALRGAASSEALGVAPPAISVVTSYDPSPGSGFASGIAEVLLKPFTADEFQEVVDLAKARLTSSQVAQNTTAEITTGSPPPPREFLSRLAIETGDKIVLVRTSDIEWVESFKNQVRLHVGDATHVVRQSMKSLYAVLDRDHFLRLHRNAIVNLDYVDEFHLPAAGEMFVQLRSGFRLPLRKSNRARIRKTLIDKSLLQPRSGASCILPASDTFELPSD